MAAFDPYATATLGLDFLPTLSPGVTLDAPRTAVAMSLLQTTAQITANEKVAVGAIPTRGGLYALEVYDNETAIPANLTSIIYAPNEDVSGAALTGWRKWTGDGITTLYANIDEYPFNASDTDDYIYMGKGGAKTYSGRVASAAALTGKRILAVELVTMAVASSGDPSNQSASTGTLRHLLNVAAKDYFGGSFTLPNFYLASWQTQSSIWYYNPGTKKPWTIADVQAFDATDEYGIVGTPGSASYIYVGQAFMRVWYCDENRLAVGVLNDSASGLTPNDWNTVPVLTPTGGAWTKDGAGRHLYLLRRFSDVGALVIPTLAGAVAPNPARGLGVTLDATYGIATVMSDPTPTVFGLVQRTSAPADSVDSQPYKAIVEAYVYSGRDAQQEFSNAAVLAYKELKGFAVKPNSATGNLLVKIKKRSDNSQVGGTLTLTVAQVAALPDAGNGWKIIDGQITTATLAAATQYYVQFSDATAADTGAGALYWSVLTLSVGGAGVGSAAGFGGTTDNATFSGSAPYDTLGYLEYTQADIPVLVSTIPTTPANVTVTQLNQALTPSLDSGEVASIEYLHVDWDATALGAAFVRYEVDRSEDGGTTWVNIATITTEAISAYDNYTSARGVQACYRVRVVRNDGATSAWSATVCATANVACAEMLFVSDTDPTLNVAYNWPESNDYHFLDADDVVFQKVYLRDYQVAFTPLERRGVELPVAVIVSALSTPTVQGQAAFDALRDLSVAPIPYVCVLDQYGGRILGNLRVPSGNRQGGAKLYVAQVIVTETDGAPRPVEVT